MAMGNIPLPDPHCIAESSYPGHWPRLLKKASGGPSSIQDP